MTLDEMIDALPREERVIVERLRNLISECLPRATEKAYYVEGILFYTGNRLICYISPPSGKWAARAKKEEKGVAFGFNQGYLMSNEDGLLLAEGRKQVYVMYFRTLNDIKEKMIKALLFEAGMIDESFRKAPRDQNAKDTETTAIPVIGKFILIATSF